MTKVRRLGTKGRIANWIKNWLSKCKQKVPNNEQAFEWTFMSSISQDFLLGHFFLLFKLIYAGLLVKIPKFTDDIKLDKRTITEQDILEF